MRKNSLEVLEYRALGSRCRRLSDYCYEQMRLVYSALNITFDPTWFAYISHLHHTGGSTIQTIADELGTSQPAVSKMMRKLENLALVHTIAHSKDKRIRHMQLSPDGLTLWQHIIPCVDTVNLLLRELDTGTNTLDGISTLEQAFARQPLKTRVLRALPHNLPIQLIPYHTDLHDFYEQHNRAWVSKYFRMEPIDEAMLRDPHTHVFPKGGEIYIVHAGPYPIGGFSLIPHEHRLELSKMYVPEALQGYGYGHIVIEQAIKRAKEKQANTLFLMSNRILTPAITVYMQHGFTEIPLTPELAAMYQRVNIVMEKLLTQADQHAA
jgi:DNA-binding MarR family transcriptional regulator/GNAT superfamily N-acetyltransferase